MSVRRIRRPAIVAGLAIAATAAVVGAAGRGTAEPRPRPVAVAIFSGPVEKIRDGDTIELEGVAVRLQGVAAPELDEPLGRESREALVRLVAGAVGRLHTRRDPHARPHRGGLLGGRS